MRHPIRIFFVLTLAAALVAVTGASAFADSPNPAGAPSGTVVTNADGSNTLTLTGNWVWDSRTGACQAGTAGYAADWGDASQPGNPLSNKNGVTANVEGRPITVGALAGNTYNPTDNAIHPAACGAGAGNHPGGPWGPISHTYPPTASSVVACVVTYHVKGKTPLAGGPNHDRDNSVEENSNVTLASMCTTFTFGSPHLKVTKTADDASISAGDQIGFHVTVENDGNAAALNVTLTDHLPAGFTWSAASTTIGTCSTSGSTFTCTDALLAAGDSFDVHLTAPTDSTDCGDVSNTATATADNAASAHDTADVTINCSDVHVAKTADAGSVLAGQDIGFTITATNSGSGTAHNVVVTDVLPTTSGTSWSMDTHTGAACAIAGGTLTCTAAALAAGHSFSAHVTSGTDITSCGTVDNTATMTVNGADAGHATASVDVVCPPPGLHLLKSGPHTAHVGDTITYTFGVSNVQGIPLHNVTLTDAKCDTAAVLKKGDTNTDSILQADEVWTYTCTHKVTSSDADPLPNTATVTGLDPNGTPVDSTSTWTVDILHPAIKLVKTGSRRSGAGGDAITFTYVVTNTSTDTTLYDVNVRDNIIGFIGTVSQLDPGQSKTLTKASTIQAAHPTNIGTATGCDTTGLCVTGSSHWTLTIVLGRQFTPLPRTGLPGASPWGLLLIAIGFGLVVVVRAARPSMKPARARR